jgi:hypothetical protein
MRPRLQRRSFGARCRRAVLPAPASRLSAARMTFGCKCSGAKQRKRQLHQERPTVGICPQASSRRTLKCSQARVNRCTLEVTESTVFGLARTNEWRRLPAPCMRASISMLRHNCAETVIGPCICAALAVCPFSQDIAAFERPARFARWLVYKHSSLVLATLQRHLRGAAGQPISCGLPRQESSCLQDGDDPAVLQ